MAGGGRRIYSTATVQEAPRRVIFRVAKTGFLFALLAVAGCQALEWRADSGTELTALPESLVREKPDR